jgi:DNA topoisomerase I
MAKSLVVVESPAKAKTLSKYLGRTFTVKASMGHVKDLPKSTLGVKIGKEFSPEYVVIAGKKEFLTEIKAIAKKVDTVFLAPDPDREGEAIAWHIAEEISKGKKNGKVKRVLFNEITKKAVLEAIKAPQELNQKKYESQQARRILDRLVGYQISPILWQKVRRGLSAGRVQSVAVRLVCDREAEIKAFIAQEYWTVEVDLLGRTPPPFRSYLFKIDGQKAEIKDSAQANSIKDELYKQTFKVSNIEKKTVSRSPQPPFITSRLQQEASRRLRFTAKKTMMLAQELYEGVEIGDEGLVGLITYMRTDSTRLSADAVAQARDFIKTKYGENYVPSAPRVYATKQRSQDAHEAIRPTSVEYPPEKITKFLSKDLYALYELIWNRFVASQMADAQFVQTSIDIEAGKYLFRATGSVIKFDGFMALYVEKLDEFIEKQECDILFPKIEEGDQFKLENAYALQHFTKPKPRFTESSLIKELEEQGIGRPSTYAAIISNIQSKKYVKKETGKFFPTDLGQLVTDLLVKSFPKIIDAAFTAKMEDELDKIEYGEKDWQEILKEFYDVFKDTVSTAKKQMRDVKREEVKTEFVCEKCSKPMVIKWGRNGHFLACSGYPDCTNTKEIRKNEDGSIIPVARESTGEKCEKCGSNMIVRHGRFGKFLACESYPKCKNTKSITTGVKCPKEGCGGSLALKKTKKGRIFYGCTNYPKCNFATWYPPVAEKCPKCSFPILVEKKGKEGTKTLNCVNEKCDFEKQL